MSYSIIAHLEHGSADSFGFTTSAIDTTGADLIVATIADYTGVAASVLTDSKGNTYIVGEVQSGGGGLGRSQIIYSINPTVGTGHTFTVTNGAVAFPTLCVTAFSGAKLTSPLDQHANAAAINHVPITPLEDDELVIAALSTDITGAISIDSGYTAFTVQLSGGNHFGCGIAYKIQTTAALTDPNWTTPGTPDVTIASFKAPAGPAELPGSFDIFGETTVNAIGRLLRLDDIEVFDSVAQEPDTFSSPMDPFAVDPIDGDTIIVAHIHDNNGGGEVSAPTDNYGNLYVHIDSVFGDSNFCAISVWYAKDVVGGSNFIVTINRGGAGLWGAIAVGLHGTSADPYNNDWAENSGVSGPATAGPTTITPPEDSMFLSFVHDLIGPVTEPPDGWTLGEAVEVTDHGFFAWKRASTVQTIGWPRVDDNLWAAVILSFELNPLAAGAAHIFGTTTVAFTGELVTNAQVDLGPPDPVDSEHPPDREPPISMRIDKSQLRNKIIGVGHGEPVLTDVQSDEPIIPVANADAWFNSSGGQAISDSQQFRYGGVIPAGVGSLVGPGITPSSRPRAVGRIGAGITAGSHQYAFTWRTAAGETKPSLLSLPVVIEHIPDIVATLAVDRRPTPGIQPERDGPPAGRTVTYYIATMNDISTPSAGGSNMIATTPLVAAGNENYTVKITPTVDVPTQRRYCLFRQDAEYSSFAFFVSDFVASLVAGVELQWPEDYYPTPDGRLIEEHISGASPYAFGPVWTTDQFNSVGQASLSAIAIGPATVIARGVFRTAADGFQLKFLFEIANNSATTLIDSTPDSSLGVNAPTADDSGLTMPVGIVEAGASEIITAGWSSATSGWAIVGQQVIRYRGVTDNTLTGIPATGFPGAILNTISYNEHIDPAPSLTGVSGLMRGLAKGSNVNILVIRNDVPAQLVMAALESTPDWTSDGVYERKIIDERRNETTLTLLCDVDLLLFSLPIKTVRYWTRDVKTRLRQPVSINSISPPITGELVIQDVSIAEIGTADWPPKFAVTASSVRFALVELFRRMVKAIGG